MARTATAAALITALTFAGIQRGSGQGGRYSSCNDYDTGCGGDNYNNHPPCTEEDRAAAGPDIAALSRKHGRLPF